MSIITRSSRRRERLDGVRDGLAGSVEGIGDVIPAEGGLALSRFLLVERNVGGSEPAFWVSDHRTPENAAAYWVTQDARRDWEIVALHDLDTGAVWEPELAVGWAER